MKTKCPNCNALLVLRCDRVNVTLFAPRDGAKPPLDLPAARIRAAVIRAGGEAKVRDLYRRLHLGITEAYAACEELEAQGVGALEYVGSGNRSAVFRLK